MSSLVVTVRTDTKRGQSWRFKEANRLFMYKDLVNAKAATIDDLRNALLLSTKRALNAAICGCCGFPTHRCVCPDCGAKKGDGGCCG